MNCLWCDEAINMEINWTSFLLPNRPPKLCKQCERGLEKLEGERCQTCSRISSEPICSDCLWWKTYHHGKDIIDFNYSIYQYNECMQDIIAKWKYRGDFELGYIFQEAFLADFKKKFNFLKNAVVIPIPLSEERLQERCFNQADMLADFLPLEKIKALSRIHGEKQSKKTRRQRISTENPFILEQSLNNPVILVDDIYTTGTTLRHAATLLKMHGCPNVFTYTLVRG